MTCQSRGSIALEKKMGNGGFEGILGGDGGGSRIFRAETMVGLRRSSPDGLEPPAVFHWGAEGRGGRIIAVRSRV